MKHNELILEKKIKRLKKAIEDWDSSGLGFAGQRRLEFMLREALEQKAEKSSWKSFYFPYSLQYQFPLVRLAE